MELEIVSKKDNPLLDRVELEVLVHHSGEPTPKRSEVREQVAAAVNAKKDQVLVDHMESTFGTGLTRGYVKVYKTKEAAMAIEREPLIKRNNLDGSGGKGGGAAKPKPTPEPKAEKPDAEEPTEEPGPAEAPAEEPPAENEPAKEGSD